MYLSGADFHATTAACKIEIKIIPLLAFATPLDLMEIIYLKHVDGTLTHGITTCTQFRLKQIYIHHCSTVYHT